MTNSRLFVVSFLFTAAVFSGYFYLHRPSKAESIRPVLVPVGDDRFVTSQLTPNGVRFLRNRGVTTIVDIRPDGEAKDQTPSSEIKTASQRYGIRFHYIPVPHESIPDSAVDTLSGVLAEQAGPVVLYCRSGRRAVRTLALAEASQPDGPETDAILAMVKAAGFAADDLRDNITQRISRRNQPTARKTDERDPAKP